jgi:predicted ABC-type exoprotein transport system permease subunit
MIPKLILKHRIKNNKYLSDVINLGLVIFILFIIGLLYYEYHDKNNIEIILK